MDAEFVLNGETYRLGKLTPMQQFYIVKRLGPAIVSFGAVVASMEGDRQQFYGTIVSMADAISRLSDADSDFVIMLCMTSTHRKQGDKWAPIVAGDGRSFMFSDITMPVMLQLTVASLKENLGNFTDALLAQALAMLPDLPQGETKEA